MIVAAATKYCKLICTRGVRTNLFFVRINLCQVRIRYFRTSRRPQTRPGRFDSHDLVSGPPDTSEAGSRPPMATPSKPVIAPLSRKWTFVIRNSRAGSTIFEARTSRKLMKYIRLRGKNARPFRRTYNDPTPASSNGMTGTLARRLFPRFIACSQSNHGYLLGGFRDTPASAPGNYGP